MDYFLITHCDLVIGGMYLVRSGTVYIKETGKSMKICKEEKTESSTVPTANNKQASMPLAV